MCVCMYKHGYTLTPWIILHNGGAKETFIPCWISELAAHSFLLNLSVTLPLSAKDFSMWYWWSVSTAAAYFTYPSLSIIMRLGAGWLSLSHARFPCPEEPRHWRLHEHHPIIARSLWCMCMYLWLLIKTRCVNPPVKSEVPVFVDPWGLSNEALLLWII